MHKGSKILLIKTHKLIVLVLNSELLTPSARAQFGVDSHCGRVLRLTPAINLARRRKPAQFYAGANPG